MQDTTYFVRNPGVRHPWQNSRSAAGPCCYPLAPSGEKAVGGAHWTFVPKTDNDSQLWPDINPLAQSTILDDRGEN
jgi:hypothetical protein